MSNNLLYTLYKDKRTVFSFNELALLVNVSDTKSLRQRVNYYVRQQKLLNPRRGIYAKESYDREELAGKIVKPAYISLEYVLQKAGIIFQYDSRLTLVSYLSRTLIVDGREYVYRKIKNEVLVESKGIIMNQNGVSIATPERAFLDLLYLNASFYVDAFERLDRNLLHELKPIYRSKALNQRLERMFHV